MIQALARLRTLATKTFRYGLINRPPSIGTLPKGEYTYSEDNEGIDRVRHGIVTYTKELTDQEVKTFELLPLSGDDGKPLECPKFPAAVLAKAKEAVDTLNYLIEENMDPADEEGIKEVFDEAHKVLDIFHKYAQSKHLDSAKALKELGYKGK